MPATPLIGWLKRNRVRICVEGSSYRDFFFTAL